MFRLDEPAGVTEEVPEFGSLRALISERAASDGGIVVAVGQPLSLSDSGHEESLPRFGAIVRAGWRRSPPRALSFSRANVGFAPSDSGSASVPTS